MYGSIAVLLRDILGFIWDPSDAFTVHICLARALILIYFPFWESVLFKLFNNDHKICNKKFYSKLISCLGTGWEIKN